MKDEPQRLKPIRSGAPEMFARQIRGASLEPCALESKPAPSSYASLAFPRVSLDLVTLGSATTYAGEMPRDSFTLVYVTSCPETGRSFGFGVEHGVGHLGVFPPGAAVEGWKPAGFAHATLTVPTEVFHSAVARASPGFSEGFPWGGGILRVSPAGQERLRNLLSDVEALAWNEAEAVGRETARAHAERDLVDAYLAALDEGSGGFIAADARLTKRFGRLRQAQDYIVAHAREPIHLDELCAALHLGRRSVESLFKDLLGVCPTVYLRHRRLYEARRALLRADPSWGGVKQVALELGFWHMGRFSSDYERLFGEKPSATLRKRD